MTLTIDLTPAEQARLAAAARQTGMEPAALAKQLVTDHLPTDSASLSASAAVREQNRIATILAAQGSLAHVLVTVDDLHHERQRDKQGENTEREDRH